MKYRFEKLHLRHFRSVRADTLDFSNPLFLVGKNGAGKSNVVDALAFLAEAMTSPLHTVFDRRGGISAVRHQSGTRSRPPSISLALDLLDLESGDPIRYAIEIKAAKDGGFSVAREQAISTGKMLRLRKSDGTLSRSRRMKVWFDRRNTDFRSSMDGFAPAIDPQGLVLPLVGGIGGFRSLVTAITGMRVYSLEPSKLRDFQEPDSGTILHRNGSNVASVLKEIEHRSSDDMLRIREMLAAVVPHTDSVTTVSHGNRLGLEFTQAWNEDHSVRFEALNMSDGTLRVLGLLVAVYQKKKPSLMVIEEPESTLHPEALGALSDVLAHGARETQMVVTTHSPELLDSAKVGEENLRLVQWDDGETAVRGVSAAAKKALQQHLMGAGELLRSNALRSSSTSKKPPHFFHDL